MREGARGGRLLHNINLTATSPALFNDKVRVEEQCRKYACCAVYGYRVASACDLRESGLWGDFYF